MGAAPVQPKPAPMSMAMSKPAKPAKPAAMPMAAAPAPAQPMAGMTPAPAKAEPAAPMGSMGSMGSTAMPPAAAMTAPMPSGETMAMEEPKPSSLNGGLILALFAALNIGVIAVAAVLKPRRKNPTASSEVKA